MKTNINTYTEQELFIQTLKKEVILVKVARIFVLLLFLAAWELASAFSLIDPFFFSSPSRICLLFIDMCKNFEIFIHTGITLYETILGFIIATILGTIIAILLWCSDYLRSILDPYIVVLNSLPKIALGPIIIVWFGAGTKSIVFMAIIITIIVTIITMENGF